VPCVPAAFMAGMLAMLRTDEAMESCNVARREREWVCACGGSQETRIKSQDTRYNAEVSQPETKPTAQKSNE
jgi:hypothetical protein